MRIGTFVKNTDGNFEGEVKTLLFAAKLRVIKNGADKGPDYFIKEVDTDIEVGAGWDKVAEQSGNPYISVKIDDPALPFPINAAINAHENGFNLNWSRPQPRNDGPAQQQGAAQPQPTL